MIRKRFDDELIGLLEQFEWWDLPIEKIKEIVTILTNSDLERVKKYVKSVIY